MFKVEKGIKAPSAKVYPFPTMELEDSFFISVDKIKSTRSAASRYASIHGVAFKIWRFGEGYRCWRVK